MRECSPEHRLPVTMIRWCVMVSERFNFKVMVPVRLLARVEERLRL